MSRDTLSLYAICEDVNRQPSSASPPVRQPDTGDSHCVLLDTLNDELGLQLEAQECAWPTLAGKQCLTLSELFDAGTVDNKTATRALVQTSGDLLERLLAWLRAVPDRATICDRLYAEYRLVQEGAWSQTERPLRVELYAILWHSKNVPSFSTATLDGVPLPYIGTDFPSHGTK